MIEDVLSNLGSSSRLTSEERLACQQAHDRLHALATEVTRMGSAEKHLRLFAERVSALNGDELTAMIVREAGELLEDMYSPVSPAQ